MIGAIEFLAAPFLACLVVVAALGYFGLHVLRREIIFVDLALAQIAALGTVVGFIFGHDPGSPGSMAYALATTVLGAAILSFTRTRDPRVPQEAIIGLTYVVASAATILVADRAPEGAEHIKELLAGAVIWVTWPTVVKTLVVCALVGLFHWIFRRRFTGISEDPEAVQASGVSLRLWDFLFYLSFGFVIVVAVDIAGVLMVFAYLVGPALVALATTRSWMGAAAVAWTIGGVASALGLGASYAWDFPAGPAIVCILGLTLLAFAAWRLLTGRRRS